VERLSIGQGNGLDAERNGVPLPVRFAPSVGNSLPAFMPAHQAVFHAIAVISRQHELYRLRKRGKTARPTKEARQSKTLYPTNAPAMHVTLRFSLSIKMPPIAKRNVNFRSPSGGLDFAPPMPALLGNGASCGHLPNLSNSPLAIVDDARPSNDLRFGGFAPNAVTADAIRSLNT